ncbi:molybdenum cofactor guanylyltransferase [Tepidiforma sp.]|uniref:molybdenum cofactor guanylyltransferase n=1 Tax=Tepidiforma sp. TaxID=2682230 RepID=UPI002ADD9B9B|nr:molybdenum cofactor guanylyltransferase [Tepidiforma sp.]
MTAGIEAIILAGGRSTRFGGDKASAPLRGRPLLQWVVDAVAPAVERIVIVHAPGQRLPDLRAPVPLTPVPDETPGLGPLAGLATGFAHTHAELAFACSCDAPLVSAALVSLLASIARQTGADVVRPFVGGFPQPLVAIYRPATCLEPFRRALRTPTTNLRIVAACEELRVIEPAEPMLLAADPQLRSFLNANTPERLAEIERLLP